MEEQVQGEAQEQKVEEPVKEVDLLKEMNALKQEVESLRSSKERLLNESKDYKSKYRSLQSQREEQERTEMESKEQWKELLEREREEKQRLANEHKSLQHKNLMQKVQFEAAKLASDANDLDDVIYNLRLTQDDVNVETGEISNLAAKVDGLREKKPYLFKQEIATMNNKVPHYKEQEKREEDLTAAEKDLELVRALQQWGQ